MVEASVALFSIYSGEGDRLLGDLRVATGTSSSSDDFLRSSFSANFILLTRFSMSGKHQKESPPFGRDLAWRRCAWAIRDCHSCGSYTAAEKK
jgi:hypothetical protein